MGDSNHRIFGNFCLDTSEKTLLEGGVPVLLPQKAMELLIVLVERHGKVVSRKELFARVWPEVFVEENNLAQYVSLLRKTFADDPRAPRYIQTVARRGYRFCYPLTPIAVEDAEAPTADTTVHATEKRVERRWFVAAGAFACTAVIALLATMWVNRPPPLLGTISQPASLVVLPYQVSGFDKTEDGADLALADDLIRQLRGQTPALRVRAITAAYRYAGTRPQAVDAARTLGVQYALDCRLDRRGNGDVLSAMLVRARDGAVLWHRKFSAPAHDPFLLQDRLATALAPIAALSPVQKREHLTRSLSAYADFELGLMFWNQRTSEGIFKSVDHLEQAVAKDPKFAHAYSALADAYACDGALWPKAEEAIQRALALNPDLAEAHASEGFWRLLWTRDDEGASSELKHAIHLDPTYASAHQWLGIALMQQSRTVEGLEESRQALELDPDSLAIGTALAQMYYVAHQFDLAFLQSEKVLAARPDYLMAHAVRLDIEVQRRHYDSAMEEFWELQKLDGANPFYQASEATDLKHTYATKGIAGFWRARLVYLQRSFDAPYSVAEYFALLGDRDAALANLTRAMSTQKTGRQIMLYAHTDPVFDSLHGDPRFEQLFAHR